MLGPNEELSMSFEKRALIVTAHPDTCSFTMALAETSAHTLEQAGFLVSRSDLYQMPFNTAAGAGDFLTVPPDPFDMQDHQLLAVQSNGFTPDLAAEIEKVRESDLIVFHFPLWWFSVPGLLKGWIDRTFAYGFAYGRHGNLAGKAAMAVTSTGGPLKSYVQDGRGTVEDYLKHFLVGTIEFCGMQGLPLFVAYGPERMEATERQQRRLPVAML
jgi:NAD(P)H dehydrogenase (quinone)